MSIRDTTQVHPRIAASWSQCDHSGILIRRSGLTEPHIPLLLLVVSPTIPRGSAVAPHIREHSKGRSASPKVFSGMRLGADVEIPPLLLYVGALIGFVVTNMILTHIIGPRKKTAVKDMPYESGMDPIGDARQPFDVKFYLVAILFLVFDVELLFLYPWAVSAYLPEGQTGGIPPELRSTVFGVMLVFMATLVIAYAYAWKKGVFKWR